MLIKNKSFKWICLNLPQIATSCRIIEQKIKGVIKALTNGVIEGVKYKLE